MAPSTLTTSAPSAPVSTGPAPRRPRWRALWAMPEVRWAAVATVLFALGGAAQLAGAPAPAWWALYLACYATGGWEPAWAGLQALREKTLDVDLLMVVAAIGAAAIGQVFDGALLIVIFATSGALEAFVTARTQESVRALLDLAPEQATRLRVVGGRHVEEAVATADLAVGDVLLVRPGERVGADGHVLDGASEVDQASITGESVPVLKERGEQVFAGTLNGTGALRVHVGAAAHDSVVARIVALVEEASATKAERQLFIEAVERRYSVGVVVATLVLFVVPLALGGALQPTLLRAMTFMIVASPCALVLATMPPLLASIANAGRHGVLVKSAVVLERLAGVDQVAFDKTGTLTKGHPHVTSVLPVPDSGRTADQVLAWAAAAEEPSEHPLARAVVAAARAGGVDWNGAGGFTATPGRGVTATVDGRRVEVGSPAVLTAGVGTVGGGAAWSEAAEAVRDVEAGGQTAAVVLLDGNPVGVLALADEARPDASAAVAALGRVTGRAPVLLTGDNPAAAAHLARQVAVADVRAGLLPSDKVGHVRALQQAGRRVLLVGDGINDAPAMAAADVGIAMGRSGSDLARQTSDAVVVRDELTTLPTVIDLARRAQRVVKANLAFASCVIVALVAWDLVGTLPLPLGVAGHEGSTVVVGLNGLRLLRRSVWHRSGSLPAPPAAPAAGGWTPSEVARTLAGEGE
jgi:cation-transporting P-type ATPase J